MRTFRLAVLVGLAAVLLMAPVCGGASSVVEAGAGAVGQIDAGNVFSPLPGRATQAAWTAERMRDAVPMPVPTAVEGQQPSSAARAAGGSGLMPGRSGGRPEATPASGIGVQDDGGGLESSARGYQCPAPFTRYEVSLAEAKAYPRRTVGILFFVQNGLEYSCTASSIGNFAIWTAGHCTHDGSGSEAGWSTNAVFVPAYAGDKPCPGQGCPFGVWTVVYMMTKLAWFDLGDQGLMGDFDMGGAVVARLGGLKISERLGWLGFAWGQRPNQHWNLFGYPGEAPFDGNRLVTCQGSLAYRPLVSGGTLSGVGCDMTAGSSGGPWIMSFGSDNYLNGNTAGRRPNKGQELLSPYFDEVIAWSLWRDLLDSTPSNPVVGG